MNTKIKIAKTTLSNIPETDENHSGFPQWLISKIHDNHMEQSHEKSDPSPALKGMLFKDEIGRKQKNPPWSLVQYVIFELDPGRFNSFACLSVRGNNFVQCLCGFNGWHLEWRITDPSGNYVHYRACYPGGSKKPFELKKHNHVNDGQHRDLLNLADVVYTFRSFHQGQGLSPWLKWRVLDI
jgi:hypothetical protein